MLAEGGLLTSTKPQFSTRRPSSTRPGPLSSCSRFLFLLHQRLRLVSIPLAFVSDQASQPHHFHPHHRLFSNPLRYTNTDVKKVLKVRSASTIHAKTSKQHLHLVEIASEGEVHRKRPKGE